MRELLVTNTVMKESDCGRRDDDRNISQMLGMCPKIRSCSYNRRDININEGDMERTAKA